MIKSSSFIELTHFFQFSINLKF